MGNNTGFEDNAAEMSRKSNKTAVNHHVLANLGGIVSLPYSQRQLKYKTSLTVLL